MEKPFNLHYTKSFFFKFALITEKKDELKKKESITKTTVTVCVVSEAHKPPAHRGHGDIISYATN